MLRFEPPLTPDAEEALAWAERELSKGVYDQTPTLWDRFISWLLGLIEAIMSHGMGAQPWVLPVIVLGVLALVVLAGFALGGPIRRRRAAVAGGSNVVLEDDDRDSAALRRAADDAARAGDFHLAVLERFRAIVRSLDERAIIDERPGRTALEATAAASARLPDRARELRAASDLFDATCYGSVQPSARDDTWLREVDAAVTRTRPTRTGELMTSGPVIPS